MDSSSSWCTIHLQEKIGPRGKRCRTGPGFAYCPHLLPSAGLRTFQQSAIINNEEEETNGEAGDDGRGGGSWYGLIGRKYRIYKERLVVVKHRHCTLHLWMYGSVLAYTCFNDCNIREEGLNCRLSVLIWGCSHSFIYIVSSLQGLRSDWTNKSWIKC